MRAAAVVLAIVALIAAGSLVLSSEETAAPSPAIPDYRAEGYVGPDACRSCHRELHDRWAASAHARSTEKASEENLPPEMVAGGTVGHAPMESVFRRDGDEFLVTTTGPDGEPREYPITHIVGPRRMSFFLTRMEDGRLQVLPSMREVVSGKWFDYTQLIFSVPGVPYDSAPVVNPGEPSFWTGPIRSYDRTCGRCHSSGRRVENTDPGGRVRAEWEPLSIDCEACHGPGRDHVEFWKNPPDKPMKDPVIVLSELGRDRAQAVCLWCHIEADVVNEHWRPGDDVFEFLTPTLLDNIERIDAAGRPLELIYDGIPFLFSRCAEEGGLTCLTCHDAHGSHHRSDLIVPEEKTFTLCEGCHADINADAAGHSHHDMSKSGGRCVNCHMPFLTIERGHGAVRDHTIGSPHPDLFGGRVAVDACTWCHSGGREAPDDAPILSREAVFAAFREWYPDAKLRPDWVEAIAAARDGRSSIFFDLVRVAGDRDNPRAVRASAAKLMAGYPNQALIYLMNLISDDDSLVRRSAADALWSIRHEDADLALLSALSDPSAAVRRDAAIAALSGWNRVQENRELLEAVIVALEADAEAAPQEDTRWFRVGAAKQLAGDLRGAIEAYEKKLALNPYATAVRRTVESLRSRLEGE